MVSKFKRLLSAVIIVFLLFSVSGCYSDKSLKRSLNKYYSVEIPDTCRCIYANTDTWGGFPSSDGVAYYIYEVSDDTDDFFLTFHGEADEQFEDLFIYWVDFVNHRLERTKGEKDVLSGSRVPDFSDTQSYFWLFKGIIYPRKETDGASEIGSVVSDNLEDANNCSKQILFAYVSQLKRLYVIYTSGLFIIEPLS